MTRIAPQAVREPVELLPRRTMTQAEKLARWEAVGRICTICRQPCEPSGPTTVIWDHRIAIALGGTNDLANMEPHHTTPCAAQKTAVDLTAIAQAKRREAKHLGIYPPSRHRLQSRGFPKRGER